MPDRKSTPVFKYKPEDVEHRPFKVRRGWSESSVPPEDHRLTDIHTVRDQYGEFHRIYKFALVPEKEKELWAQVRKVQTVVVYDELTVKMEEIRERIALLEKQYWKLYQRRDESCLQHRKLEA
jgi:hypothetical protein